MQTCHVIWYTYLKVRVMRFKTTKVLIEIILEMIVVTSFNYSMLIK